jgi:regulatory protein SWI6
VSSAMKGRAAVGRYYLESLLEFVVRQGSAASSQEAGMSFGMDGTSAKVPTMTLARFMTEIVNTQDKSGDTALNLAARTSTTSIIDQLIEVGADPHISNRGGLAPVDFGVGNDANPSQTSHLAMLDGPIGPTNSSQQSFAEAQSGIMTCKSSYPPQYHHPTDIPAAMRDTLTACEVDFQSELRDKQTSLDKTNAALKESGTALADERRRLDDLQARVREREDLEQKIKNLQRSAAELRTQLNQPPDTPATIAIGEADRGLDFDGQLPVLDRVFPTADPGFSPSNVNPGMFTAEQRDLLAGFERESVLRGRSAAYAAHNAMLAAQAKERYRKIVSLCTGAEEGRVDELLDNLVQAVVSEQKEEVELGRVREFLRMVKGE